MSRVVGIVGGVGSGKSSIVRLVKGLRLHIVDADRIGHRLLLEPEVAKELVAEFGDDICLDDEIDRRKLGALVFGADPDSIARRAILNRILHPRIRARMHGEIQHAPAGTDFVILDAALLLEAGWQSECDAIVFIDTPLKLRRQRVLETRAWKPDELAARESAQWPLDRKRAAANFVVDNSGTPEAAAGQLEQFLRHLAER